MKSIRLPFFLILFVFSTAACNDSSIADPEDEVRLIGASGKAINMDGVWEVACVQQGDVYLSETFAFDGPSLVISIYIHATATCHEAPINAEVVTITMHHAGTFNAALESTSVLSNKIDMLSKSSRDNVEEELKQTIYVDDRSTPFKLYHGVFADDGGTVTGDGYPSQLHAIAISRQ